MRDPRERLRDILEAISAIERYLNRGRAAFEQDELLQRWFVSNLQIIGEAARALPDEVRLWLQRLSGTRSSGCETSWFMATSTSTWTSYGMPLAVTPRRSGRTLERLLQRLEELGDDA